MVINQIEVGPGESRTIDVNIAKLPSHSSIDISVRVDRSEKPGPVLLLTGGLHGDEINGIEIVRRMLEHKWNVPTAGTTICIPIINIYGFIHSSRYVPDGKDVNRSFPGNKNGSLASRVAHYLMKDIIPQIDLGLDFHTGGADRTNYPQIRCALRDPSNAELAAAFQAPFIVDSKYRPKSIRQQSARKGKHILVYEGGESSRFDEFAIQMGIQGALRVMKHLGMREEEVSPPDYETRIIKSSSWVRARASGLLQSLVESGQAVSKNEIVAYITDPFAEFKVPVKSPAKGFVIGLNNNPILHQGDAIMHIGVTRD